MKSFVLNGKFLSQSITGVQRFAMEIILELDKIIDNEDIILAVPEDIKINISLNRIRCVTLKPLTGTLWEQITFPLYAIFHGYVPINLCGPSPLLRPGISVLHDVTFKVIPSNFRKVFTIWYDIMYKNAIRRADKLITISRFSESEIKKYYKTEREFFFIENAWQHYNRISEDASLERFHLKDDFFFSLSSLKPSKNLKWIAELALRNPDVDFLVAGGINKDVFSKDLGFSTPENLLFIGYVSDEEAKALMKKCRGFLFPTLYEGFGIPPLEAMASGCRNVIVSDISVMHEIFGDSVHYVNNTFYDYKVLDFKAFNEDKINNVLKKYSWKKSAGKLVRILQDYSKY